MEISSFMENYIPLCRFIFDCRWTAKATRVPQTRISEILAGRRAITSDTGLRFARALGLSDGFWINLQTAYDLANAKEALGAELDAIEVLVAA
jgi:addiction module HigA family antidote